MRSLFLKIFLWFWATAIVTGIALVLTFILQRGAVPARWHAMLEDSARFSGTLAVEAAERGGVPAASAYLGRLQNDAHVRACLFDDHGSPTAGPGCGNLKDVAEKIAASRRSDFTFKYGIAHVGMTLTGASGRRYIFVTELPAGPRAAVGFSGTGIALHWGVAILVSGFVCYLLTLYITRPVLQLREASQQLARGELSSRAAPTVEQRRDELGDLVRDFNSMADRVEQLIGSQRQLIYDVSHEVRSPLARLNVALDLARERKGQDPAFDHMEQDLQRLDQTIERLLTVARLDTSSAPIPMSRLDLRDLVLKIVADARFETEGQNRAIDFSADEDCQVNGNAELLHSAIENVIRNAVRYSAMDTTIQILLRPGADVRKSTVLLSIRDYGPGVPEAELSNIFRPFYRIENARDRGSGGTGLGLAIADRIIRLHGGQIWAENAKPQGLCVKVVLPIAAG